MITLTREEAQQVLDAFEAYQYNGSVQLFDAAIETLRARLAQPESEPVAWTVGGLITDFSRDFSAYKTKTYTRPLYTAPPQPKLEPAAWIWDVYNGAGYSSRGIGFQQTDIPFAKHTPLYTAPPQRKEWQGLTDEEINKISDEWRETPNGLIALSRAIEAKLEEKNI